MPRVKLQLCLFCREDGILLNQDTGHYEECPHCVTKETNNVDERRPETTRAYSEED